MIAVTLLYILVLAFFLLQFALRAWNRKLKLDKGFGPQEQWKSIPYIPIYLYTPWLLTFGRGRVINFCTHIVRRFTVVQTNIFGLRVIFINDYRLGKEVFNKSAFSGRPTSDFVQFSSKGLHGTLMTQGEQWKIHRRFTHTHLKQFGFNTKLMEFHTQNEIEDLVQSWCKKGEKPFAPHKTFYIPILSSLWVILSGRRIITSNPKFFCDIYETLGKIWEFPELFVVGLPLKLSTLNTLVTWIPIFPAVKAFQKSVESLHAYLGEMFREKKASMDFSASPRDLVEVYLQEIKKTTDPKSGFYGKEGELNLLAVATEFFFAGGDTTASMLGWCMLHLTRNPDVQENIRREIESVVGSQRRPVLSDRQNCPYTQAFLCEVLRFSPFAALGVPHETTEDTNIGPHFVRKGTVVLLNIYGIHHDPKIWGDPQNFRPQRFLSPDLKTCIKHEALCTFSVGQRRCPGEQLALDNMFIFVSAICQRFFLKPDPSLGPGKMPEVREMAKSIFHSPDMFHVVAVDRLKVNGN